jgi:DNA-binding response OmpR family regulator
MSMLNVIALGNEHKMQRITACVSQAGINIVVVPQMDDAIIKLRSDHYDIILVDSAYEKAEFYCQSLCILSNIPVILLIAGAEANWPDYCSFKVDGFLSEESSNAELAARIKAFSRRRTRYQLEPEINFTSTYPSQN